MGLEIEDGYDVSIDAADAYWTAITEDCEVLGLTSRLSDEQQGDWFIYLVEYSYLFTGCPLVQEPPEGGLAAFGPAHLESAGLASPALGAEDARRLSEHFSSALVTMLGLTDSDREAVERELARSAREQIDPSLSTTLSECSVEPDPGAPDAGGADAGP
jgi:hypothetical protein